MGRPPQVVRRARPSGPGPADVREPEVARGRALPHDVPDGRAISPGGVSAVARRRPAELHARHRRGTRARAGKGGGFNRDPAGVCVGSDSRDTTPRPRRGVRAADAARRSAIAGGLAAHRAGPGRQLSPDRDAGPGCRPDHRERLQQDREALERVLAQAGDTAGLSPDALAVVGSVQSNPDLVGALGELTSKRASLRALRYKYSDQYPPVQRLIEEITTLQRQTIPTLARGLLAQLTAREADLGRRLGTDSRTLRDIPARAIEEARLRRDVSLSENLFTMLQQRYEEARLAEASTIPDVRILDAAVVSRRPVQDLAGRLIVMGFCGSFGLAVVGAVLLDRIDPRVRYPDQDRKSTRLNSSHTVISYAVFCLKKKKNET